MVNFIQGKTVIANGNSYVLLNVEHNNILKLLPEPESRMAPE